MRKLVFVADDYDHLADIMAGLLRRQTGWETASMKDGVEVLALASKRRPDVCLLDIDMPHIGGVEAAQKLRLLYPGDCPLLIAMSGITPDMPITQSQVFDHFFTKPLDIDAVVHLLGAT